MTPTKDERAEAAKSLGGLFKSQGKVYFTPNHNDMVGLGLKGVCTAVHLDVSHLAIGTGAAVRAYEGLRGALVAQAAEMQEAAFAFGAHLRSGEEAELKQALLDIARDKGTCERLKIHYAPDAENGLTPAQQFALFKRSQCA